MEQQKIKVFLLALAHPRWASLHQFLIMRMNKSKLSIWNQKHWRCVTTPSILKILSISICEPTMLSIWWTKHDTCKSCMKCLAHHPKGFAISISHTHNCWILNDGIINKNNLPNEQSSSSNVGGFTIVFTRFKCK
jgi:hypothetical protein